MIRRFSCFFVALAVLFCVSVPVFATGTEIGPYTGGVGVPVSLQAKVDIVDLFDYIDGRVDRVVEGAGDALTGFARFAYSLIDEDVCPNAPQFGGTHNFIPRRTTKDGQIGLYYVCEYCGKAYGDALEEAYQEYVQTLPGQSYNSDGAFLWVPGVEDFVSSGLRWVVSIDTSGASGTPVDQFIDLSASFPSASCDYSGSFGKGSATAFVYVGDYVDVSIANNTYLYSLGAQVIWPSVVAPVDGFYTVCDTSASSSNVSRAAYSAGSILALGSCRRKHLADYKSSGRCQLLWPAFWIEPYAGGSGGNTYEIQTRVAGDNNIGLYGYVQDGQLYQSTVGTIYNETSNVYQNPVTGDTSNISSWQYDYGDRSYTLTTEEGDTVTVTYGDSNVTINEGGATYNVYYLMEETEEVQADLESRCDHDYTSTVTTAPTCTASGVRTYTCANCGVSYTQTVSPTGHNYQSAVTMAPTCVNTGVTTFTCSDCGDSYTVSLPATGHVWEVVRTVPTAYDSDTGQLVQQGYTLYECSVCHEQYKIDADSGGSSLPAPSSGGTSTGTDLSTDVDSGVGRGFLATIAHGLTEDLPAAIQAASSWFTSLPQLYEGYTGFLAASVVWLPSDIQALLRFAVGFVTFVGIIRRIWGRG